MARSGKSVAHGNRRSGVSLSGDCCLLRQSLEFIQSFRVPVAGQMFQGGDAASPAPDFTLFFNNLVNYAELPRDLPA